MQDANELSDAPSPGSIPSESDLQKMVIDTLEDTKAEDIIKIDLKGKTSIADSMVIASGRSTRQVAAMADRLHKKLKHAVTDGCKIEGMEKADWVLLDAGSIIIHIFRPEVRQFYNLEKMWAVDFTPDKMLADKNPSEEE